MECRISRYTGDLVAAHVLRGSVPCQIHACIHFCGLSLEWLQKQWLKEQWKQAVVVTVAVTVLVVVIRVVQDQQQHTQKHEVANW